MSEKCEKYTTVTRVRLGLRLCSTPCLAPIPVTGPANVQQTGSQPACQTQHLITPLTACLDSSWSMFMTTSHNTEEK